MVTATPMIRTGAEGKMGREYERREGGEAPKKSPRGPKRLPRGLQEAPKRLPRGPATT